MDTLPDRRARRRLQSEDEILTLARALLEEAGAEGLTLRGLATRLGMAPSGVHYYFSSRDTLIAALVTRAFQEMALAIDAALVLGQRPQPLLTRWTAGASAYARWACAEPELFELAHSRATARLKAVPGLLEAKNRVAQALMAPLLEAVQAGQARPPVAAAAAVPLVQVQLRAWGHAIRADLPDEVLLGALLTYIALQGQVLLVLTGSLPDEFLHDDALLAAHLQTLVSGWSLPPTVSEAAEPARPGTPIPGFC